MNEARRDDIQVLQKQWTGLAFNRDSFQISSTRARLMHASIPVALVGYAASIEVLAASSSPPLDLLHSGLSPTAVAFAFPTCAKFSKSFVFSADRCQAGLGTARGCVSIPSAALGQRKWEDKLFRGKNLHTVQGWRPHLEKLPLLGLCHMSEPEKKQNCGNQAAAKAMHCLNPERGFRSK